VTGARVRYRNGIEDSDRWQRFSLRAGDIIISTPPKSGTTWMQMICGLLIFQRTTFDRSLDVISPWLEMQIRDIDNLSSELDAQRHRRFIKSHTPFDGLPDDPEVTYICVGRDPRDVAISWAHHQDNLDLQALFSARDRAVGNEDLAEMYRDIEFPPSDPVERFWYWVDASNAGELSHVSLAATMHHLATFWAVREQRNVILVHYADLQRDLDGEMRRIARRLDIDIDEGLFPDLVAAAGFDTMRERANEIAPDTTFGIFQSNQAFFRSGRTGQWQELLDEAGRRRYAERVKQLAPIDVIEWAHDGPVADHASVGYKNCPSATHALSGCGGGRAGSRRPGRSRR
jgi:aryl sulfotransferase